LRDELDSKQVVPYKLNNQGGKCRPGIKHNKVITVVSNCVRVRVLYCTFLFRASLSEPLVTPLELKRVLPGRYPGIKRY